MPYGPASATKHTKKADTPSKKSQWAKVFNSVASKGGDESSAFAQAAGVVKKNRSGKSRPKRGGKSR